MSREYPQILDLALRLSPDERKGLADLLIDSVEGPADPDRDASWLAELERRRERGFEDAVPWDDARRRVLARLTDEP